MLEATERPYRGRLVHLGVNGVPGEIAATEEHPFWARRRTGKYLQRYAVRKEYPPEWVRACDLKPGDWLSIPKRPGLPATELSADQLHAIGFWLAEGSLILGKPPVAEPRGIGLANTDMDLLRGPAETFRRWFPDDVVFRGNEHGMHPVDMPAREHYGVRRGTTSRQPLHQWRLRSRAAAAYFDAFKRPGHGNKVIPDDLFKHSGLLPLVAGFIDGDGSQRSGQQRDVNCFTVSETLAWQLRQILLDAGIWCTIRPSRRSAFRSGLTGKTIENPLPLWTITIKASFLRLLPPCKVEVPEQRFVRRVIEDEAAFYAPIRRITYSDYDGPVYNLAVDGDNSYVAGAVGVHNSLHDDRVVAYAIAEQMRRRPQRPFAGVVGGERPQIDIR